GVTFMTLEDERGTANVIIWRAVWNRVARNSPALLVTGPLQRSSDGLNNVIATDFIPLNAPHFLRSRNYRSLNYWAAKIIRSSHRSLRAHNGGCGARRRHREPRKRLRAVCPPPPRRPQVRRRRRHRPSARRDRPLPLHRRRARVALRGKLFAPPNARLARELP